MRGITASDKSMTPKRLVSVKASAKRFAGNRWGNAGRCSAERQDGRISALNFAAAVRLSADILADTDYFLR